MPEQYALISEGFCPHGHGPLQRQGAVGWCGFCGNGWSVQGDEVSLHIEADSSEVESALANLSRRLGLLRPETPDG